MFDHHSRNTINSVPEAATAEAPVRLELGNDVYWIRPSNVLRLHASADAGGRPKYLSIIFSDGKTVDVYAGGMTHSELARVTDATAAKLWPGAASAAVPPRGWDRVET